MTLQNSYIFLENPFKKVPPQNNDSTNEAIVLVLPNSVHTYLKRAFPNIEKTQNYHHFHKTQYYLFKHYDKYTCKVQFTITNVVDTEYLDINVEGNTLNQIVKCLEDIQHTLENSGIRERFVDIISYDAISEYYCNKIYPSFNNLERNLRKLLFNIYIVNFGRDYYKVTINDNLQKKVKGVINTDTDTSEKREKIRSEFNTKSKKDAEEINRLQRFFYSLDYNDIQTLLFSSNWTPHDEDKKNKFLEKHHNLSVLSDEELRAAFSKFTPQSDWKRFFNSKIDIANVEDLIEDIRKYRNEVAHFKFFYKKDYDECRVLINKLNSAIIKAILLTEEKDFLVKNLGELTETLQKIAEGFESFKRFLLEFAQKTVNEIVSWGLTELGKRATNRILDNKNDIPETEDENKDSSKEK